MTVVYNAVTRVWFPSRVLVVYKNVSSLFLCIESQHRQRIFLLPVAANPIISDIPGYFSYARDFTICDKYFSEVAGPSTPNHLMLICADAPLINNPAHHYNPKPGDAFKLPSLPAQLEKAG